MKTYKVDLDYEASLFDPHYNEKDLHNLKLIKEFEYVFFLVNKEKAVLKNIRSYDETYLQNLKQMGFVIPDFKPEATQYNYWWGSHHNFSLEQKLNSKLTSSLLAHDNGWGFEKGAIVENLFELCDHLKKFPEIQKWIIKRPDSFSGIGHYQLSSDSFDEIALTKLVKEKVLLEPVYERLFDIGTTFEINDGIIKRQFMVENFNAHNGGFKGGAGTSSVDKFKKYILKKYNYSLDELEHITRQIAKTYLNLGALSNIQIDSFIYLEDGKQKLYALVEVNYRKTMGLVIQSLAEKYHEADWIEWRIETSKSIKNNPLGPEWIRLSPDGNHFQSYFSKISITKI